MSGSSSQPSQPMIRLLQGVACVVIIMWGIRTASHILVLLAMALLLAYAFVPLPQWLMQRFRLGKTPALLLTVALLGTLNVITVILLYDSVGRMRTKLPMYHERFMDLFEKSVVLANAHGINFADLSTAKVASSDRILEFSRMALSGAGSFLGDGLLISALAWILLIQMVGDAGAKRGALAEKLAYYGSDVQRYIAISAETGIITALANLIVFVAVGVDFPIIWCVLYFFLHFIPNVGFILAIVPPAFLALLMLGWQKALLVAGCLVLTQMLTDYGLTPILMKKGVDISLLEITVSLMVWGFLLGPAGEILAIPLTITLRKFIEKLSTDAELDARAIGVTSPTQPVVESRALAGA
jgi:AI-2 transport protein TqsA